MFDEICAGPLIEASKISALEAQTKANIFGAGT